MDSLESIPELLNRLKFRALCFPFQTLFKRIRSRCCQHLIYFSATFSGYCKGRAVHFYRFKNETPSSGFTFEHIVRVENSARIALLLQLALLPILLEMMAALTLGLAPTPTTPLLLLLPLLMMSIPQKQALANLLQAAEQIRGFSSALSKRDEVLAVLRRLAACFHRRLGGFEPLAVAVRRGGCCEHGVMARVELLLLLLLLRMRAVVYIGGGHSIAGALRARLTS
jgi:hypothetical protein